MLNERKLTKSELNKREDIIKDMKKNKRALVKKYGKDAESVMYGRATNIAKKQTESMNQDKLREMLQDALQNPKKADLNKDGKLSDYEEKRGAAIEKSMTKEGNALNENKQEAAEELQMIMDQLYELSDQAKMIFRNNFPTEYRRLDAYGALDFGTSSNRYDVTLEGTLENLDMEDDDEDLMEGKDSTHKVKYSKSNDTYQVWLGDEIVTDFATKEKANAEAKRLNALQDAKRIDKAQMKEDMDLGHQDNEPHMLKADLYRIGKYAMELYQMVDGFEGQGEVDFPHWWQSKISNAKSSIVGAKHYLDFELKEPQIDAMVDVAQDVEAIDEAVGKFVVRPCSNPGTPFAVWQTSKDGENDKRIEGFKTKEDAQKFADEKNSLKEEDPGKADMVASSIQKAMNKHKGDESKTYQLQQARKAMNKGDLDKAEKIAKRLAEKLKGDKKSLNEYTDNDFSGEKLITNTPDISGDKLAAFDDFFPNGVASRGNAVASLQSHDKSGIKARMGRYAPMFVHVQYHDFQDVAGEKYRVHQKQFYNSNFKDKDPNFNPSVTKLSLTKLADPSNPSPQSQKDIDLGSILVKTDEYIKDLKDLDIINRQS